MNEITRSSGVKYRLLTVLIFLIVSSLVYSCGGGGGGSSSNNNPQAPPVGTAVTLSWDAPTTTVDGSPLTDLAGYRIYYSTESGKYNSTDCVSVGKDVTTYTLENIHLAPGTYYFTVTAYDTGGNESDYAKQVSKIIN